MTRLLAAVLATLLAAPLAAPPFAAARAHHGLHNRKKLRKQLRRKGLAALPSVADVVAGAKASANALHAADVSGTPPALLDIAGMAVEDLFWAPGVVDAIA